MRTTWIALALMVCLCPCSSCIPGGLASGRHGKTLPTDWPIPQLTFGGDVQLVLADAQGVESKGENGEETQWMAYVHSEQGREKVRVCVRECLAPLGYVRIASSSEVRDDGMDIVGPYFSKDGKMSVFISDDVTRGRTVPPLKIHREIEERRAGNKPDPATIKDFIVFIVIKDRPFPDYVDASGVNGGQSKLEPITED